MSEHFNGLLSGVAETAADAATKPGAAVARRRGRQWRAHRRLAAGAISLALLGGAGSVAAVNLGHGGGRQTTTTKLASPSPAASDSGSPAAVPSGTVPGASSSATSTTTTTSRAPNPDTYVAGAWIPATQLPYAPAGVTIWKSLPGSGIGKPLGSEVYQQSSAMFQETIGQCTASRSGPGLANILSGSLLGDQYDSFETSGYGKIRPDGATPYSATQESLFYQNTMAARKALGDLAQGYADCKREITGTDPTTGATVVAQIQRTLETANAECWSIYGERMLDHACFVRSGSMIESIDVELNEVASLSTLEFTSLDATEVAQLQQALQAYGTE